MELKKVLKEFKLSYFILLSVVLIFISFIFYVTCTSFNDYNNTKTCGFLTDLLRDSPEPFVKIIGFVFFLGLLPLILSFIITCLLASAKIKKKQ